MFGTPTQTSAPQAQAQAGPDLPTVTTEKIGFSAVAGDTKIRLLPTPWPNESLPKPTSSLLSVASKKGLLAAAGPESIIVASTQSVREAFTKDDPSTNGTARTFVPQLSIPMQRVSQICFSSDESYLVLTAEQGGGLAVYSVDSLLQNNLEMAFAISTQGIGVRALVPNPTDGTIFALALTDGKLMVANLKDRNFVQGPTGPVLREGVSCVAWSTKGRQMVAGFANGTALQMTPDGTVKAEVPYPPQVGSEQPSEHHMSAISWLNNDTFLAMYTPSDAPGGGIPDSQYVLIQRPPKTTNFTFHRMPDPCPPFGLERTPTHQFVCRLKDFPPSLTDMLIVASSTAGDIGVFANSQDPLASDAMSQSTAKTYVYAAMADDSRRAQLPVDGMSDTSPIGMVIDLSSNEPVKRPIPADSDIDSSATPLPLLLTLNNQGVLSAWWVVYSDSVRQKTAYPGLVAVETQSQQQQEPSKAASSFANPASAQGSSFGAPSAATGTTFGQPSAFGAPSSMGAARPSPWASQPSSSPTSAAPGFGKPAFGSPSFGTPGGSAFGSSAGLGSRQSAWGAPAGSSNANDKPNPFGSAAAGVSSPFGALASGKPTASPFGAVPNSASTSSPFGAFGNDSKAKSPFGGLGGDSKPSAFGSSTTAPPLSTGPSFGSTVTIGSSLGGQTSFGAPSTFGTKSPWATPSLSTNPSDQAKPTGDDAMMDDDAPAETSTKPEQKPEETPKQPTNLFGMPSGGFQLSNQQNAEPAKEGQKKADGNNLFGSSFGAELDKVAETPATPVKKEPQEETLSTKNAQEEKDSQSKHAEESAPVDDPLPPDPVTNKKLYESVKDPLPNFGTPKPPEAETVQKPAQENASEKPASTPAPESPKPALPDDNDSASLAGSSPVDLGAPSPPEASTFNDEGQKSTETKKAVDRSPSRSSSPSKTSNTTRPGPAFTFPKAGRPSELSKPRDEFPLDSQRTPTTSLFGNNTPSFTPGTAPKPAAPESSTTDATKPPFMFQRPDATQDPLRSPSPVRADRTLQSSTPSATRRISPMRNRSTQRPKSPQRVPAPAINFDPPKEPDTNEAPQLQFPAAQSSSVKQPRNIQVPTSPTSSASSTSGKSEVKRGPPVEDDTADLEVEQELQESVRPSKSVPAFTAHQDYVSNLRFPPGLPTSTEKVYRDIQSMIDTLGLNARAIKSFTGWHQDAYFDGGRTRSDLAKEDDWCLVEVEDLGLLQRDMEKHLDAERLENPRDKIAQLTSMLRELGRLRSRHADIHRLVALHSADTAEAERARKTQLSVEQSSTLRDLHKAYSKVQSQLSRAEDALTELSAKLASLTAQNGNDQTQPTVEAVINTIAKMTRMAEGRRNEVDVLEAQLRRAGFRPRSKAQSRLEEGTEVDDLRMSTLSLSASQRLGKVSTPRSKTQASPGRFKLELSSDEENDDDDDNNDDFASVHESPLRRSTNLRSSVSRSPGGALAVQRASGELPAPSDDAVAEWRAKQARKSKVFGKLRGKIVARTPGAL